MTVWLAAILLGPAAAPLPPAQAVLVVVEGRKEPFGVE